jgi:hypothetical protein
MAALPQVKSGQPMIRRAHSKIRLRFSLPSQLNGSSVLPLLPLTTSDEEFGKDISLLKEFQGRYLTRLGCIFASKLRHVRVEPNPREFDTLGNPDFSKHVNFEVTVWQVIPESL